MVGLREIRRIRPDFAAPLRKAKELGLTALVKLSEEDHHVLFLLDDLYSSKQLQYIVTAKRVSRPLVLSSELPSNLFTPFRRGRLAY